MAEMVEVMKNEDKRAGGEPVYCLVNTPKEWRHSLTSSSSHSNLFQLLAEELHLTFVLPSIQFYSPWLKWNFQHIHISQTPNWAVIGFQAQFVHDKHESTRVCS